MSPSEEQSFVANPPARRIWQLSGRKVEAYLPEVLHGRGQRPELLVGAWGMVGCRADI